MIHAMTARSNPRLIFLGLLLLALPVFGIILLLTVSGIGGVIGLLASGFIAYQITQYMLPKVRARIETSDNGIVCTRPGSDDIAFCWPEVTQAGLIRQKSEKPSIFVYNENTDQLVLIPQEFSDFDQLLACVRQQAPFQDVQLDAAESIQDWLRQCLKISPPDVGEPNDEHDEQAASTDDIDVVPR